MQNKAFIFTIGTAIAGAFAFFMRWLQNINIMDEETGLATRGAGISVVVVLVLIAAVGVLAWLCKKQATGHELTDPDLAMPETIPGEKYLNLALAVIIGIAGLVQFAQADAEHWAEADITVHKISAAVTVIAALAYMLLSFSKKSTARCTGAALITLYGCVWLVAVYKTAASDPVVWRNIIAILAVCAFTAAAYYVAGYYFGEAKPLPTRFFCAIGAFLNIMTLVDEHTTGELLAFIAAALLQLLWLYRLTVGLEAKAPAETEEAPVEEG